MSRALRTYIFFFLLINAVTLFLGNLYADFPHTGITSLLDFTTRLLSLITAIAVIIHFIVRKKSTYRISIITMVIFFLMNLSLVPSIVQWEIAKREFAKVEMINSCERATLQFNEDLKNKELMFITFGLAPNETLSEKLKDYDIRAYHAGCIIQPALECYNELVISHFSEKTKDEFWTSIE